MWCLSDRMENIIKIVWPARTHANGDQFQFCHSVVANFIYKVLRVVVGHLLVWAAIVCTRFYWIHWESWRQEAEAISGFSIRVARSLFRWIICKLCDIAVALRGARTERITIVEATSSRLCSKSIMELGEGVSWPRCWCLFRFFRWIFISHTRST